MTGGWLGSALHRLVLLVPVLGLIFALVALGAAAAEPSGGVGALTLDDAIERILERSTELTRRRAELRATEARNLPHRLRFLPTLGVEARKAHERTVLGEGLGQRDSRETAVEGVARLNLFRFGADFAQLGASRAEESARHADVEGAELTVERTATEAIVAQILSLKQVEIETRIAESQSESLRIAHQRYQRGLLPQQEVERVETDLENGRARISDAQVGELESRATLLELLGHERVATRWAWQARLEKVSARLGGEPDLSARPDWRAAQSQLETEAARYRRDSRSILPSLDSRFSYGWFDRDGENETGWTGALLLTIPLFDHLTLYSAAREQSQVRTAAEASLEQVRRRAKAEWDTRSQALQISVSSARLREKTLASARRLYQDAQRRLQLGRLSANELAVELRRLLEAELLSAQGWAAAHVAYANYCHSKGKRVSACEGAAAR